jgi:hypothetical protein
VATFELSEGELFPLLSLARTDGRAPRNQDGVRSKSIVLRIA